MLMSPWQGAIVLNSVSGYWLSFFQQSLGGLEYNDRDVLEVVRDEYLSNRVKNPHGW
jgi:hypothetical protein